MNEAVLVALEVGVSAVLTYLSLLALRPALQRYALAEPTGRSSHSVPTPQGAGVAVVAATLFVSLLSLALIGDPAAVTELAILAGGALAMMAVGIVDDLRGLRPAARLAAQFALALIVLAGLPEDVRIVPDLPIGIERGILLVGTVWFVNLYNFMDGIDWMSVAETVPVAVAVAVVGVLGLVPIGALVIAAALAGATAGFAPFNRPVASMFLGDAGSLPIGLIVAWLLIVTAASGYLAAAVILPLYYVTDSGLTLARRAVRRERVWEAHRTHYYQLATARGMPVAGVIARVSVVNVALAALALATVLARSVAVDVSCLAAGMILVGWLLRDFQRGRR